MRDRPIGLRVLTRVCLLAGLGYILFGAVLLGSRGFLAQIPEGYGGALVRMDYSTLSNYGWINLALGAVLCAVSMCLWLMGPSAFIAAIALAALAIILSALGMLTTGLGFGAVSIGLSVVVIVYAVLLLHMHTNGHYL